MFALLSLLALAPGATAGELVLLVGEPVVIVVDGQTLPLTPGTSQARASGLAGGGHLVEIRDRSNRIVAEATVQVGPTEEVRLRFSKGTLSELGRGPMVAGAPGAPPAVSTQAAAVSAATPAGGVSLNLSVTESSVTGVQPQGPEGTGFSMSVDLGSMSHGDFEAEAEPVPQPMAPGDFTRLLASVQAQSFSSQQVDIITTAARNNYLSCAQLRQLIEPISFSSDKVEAVKAARGAVVDPQNAHELEGAFTFSSNKEEVRRLFR